MARAPDLPAAIETWHEGLAEEGGEESSAWLTDQLRRRGLFFGERPLCKVLRPRFLSPAQYDLLRQRIPILLRAFDKALKAALKSETVLHQFGLLDWERELIKRHPKIPASPLSRLDAFFEPQNGRLRFTEYNAETPAGSAYNDALTELFLTLPAVRPFLKGYSLRPLPAAPHVLHALIAAYQKWSGLRHLPVIGILDWSEVPTRNEFLLFQQYFESMGVTCEVADVRDCELRNGKLVAAGTPIDLIYKRVLIHELVERMGMDHAIVRAVQSGAVCMVNPFRCKILHKKASLAVLSDERNQHLWSAREQQIINEHVPWTRVVEERSTMYAGQPIDLLPWMAVRRERLVLKPNDDYGGAGIVLGWEVDQEAWSAAIQRALSEPYIVQERITLPSESFPTFTEGRLDFSDRIVDTAPFCFEGTRMDGCLTRVSTDSLVNVTAGGGSSVPTFVVEKR